MDDRERDALVASERQARLENQHLRRHLALLTRGSRALGAFVGDDVAALDALARSVVRDFADWCAVDIVRDSGLDRVAAVHVDPAVEARAADLRAAYPRAADVVHRVIATGQSELAWDRDGEQIAPTDTEHRALAAALGLDSCLVVPIRIHGLSVGALTCGTTANRRGFRPSDVQAVEELAARTATAIERISLYGETRRAASDAAARAHQLRRLMNAALAIQPHHQVDAIAAELARQACSVLGARGAVVDMSGSDRDGHVVRAVAGDPQAVRLESEAAEADDHLLTAALRDREGRLTGAIAVGGYDDAPLTADDESILVALAQLGSIALDNARLYETVRAGEARVLALISAAPVAVVEFDREGRVVRANGAAHALLGVVDPDAAPDASEPGTLHPQTAAVLDRVVADAVARDPSGPATRSATADIEVVVRRRDGSSAPISIAVATLRDGDENVDGVLVVASDLTARRELENRLARAQRIEAVGQVAGGVAHDFNNLLTVILGHAALLGAGLGENDARAADVRAISIAAERAAGVTAQLLTISRGDLVPTEVFDPRLRLERLAETLRSLLPASIDFHLDIEPGQARVRMSPSQFDQVLMNLTVNARDAIGETGAVRIRLRGEAPVVIEVSDDGAGMDETTAARCFEPFFSTKTGERGTGLGLATVQSVVTAVGGEVTLTSEVGAGASFVVRLPGTAERPAVVDDPVAATDTRGSERILLVEDEPGLRRLAVEMLRGAGYDVTAAADGRAALDIVACSDAPPDLVVTDVVMPRLGGVGLATELRRDHPDLPVLFMTGYADETSRAGLHGAQVLIKPFMMGDLAECVRQTLDRAVGVGQGSNR